MKEYMSLLSSLQIKVKDGKRKEDKANPRANMETVLDFRKHLTEKQLQERGKRGQEKIAPSIQQAGIYSLEWEEKSVYEIASKFGNVEDTLLKALKNCDWFSLPDKLSNEGRIRYCTEAITERIPDFEFSFTEKGIKIFYEYSLKYDLYFLYFPYMLCRRKCRKLSKLFLHFLKGLEKLGMSFAWDDYRAGCTLEYFKEDYQLQAEMEGDEPDPDMVENMKEAKLMEKALDKIKLDIDALENELKKYRSPVKVHNQAAKLMLEYIPLLREDDKITNYDTYKEYQDAYDKVFPHECFLIWNNFNEHIYESWMYSNQENLRANPVFQLEIKDLNQVRTPPDFPQRMTKAVCEFIDVLEKIEERYKKIKK